MILVKIKISKENSLLKEKIENQNYLKIKFELIKKVIIIFLLSEKISIYKKLN